jgi:hypothetical protein
MLDLNAAGQRAAVTYSHPLLGCLLVPLTMIHSDARRAVPWRQLLVPTIPAVNRPRVTQRLGQERGGALGTPQTA